jgi:hypothetical protein
MSGTGFIPSNFNAETSDASIREDRTDNYGVNHNSLLEQPADWKVLISRDSNISFLETVDLPSLELIRSVFAEFL